MRTQSLPEPILGLGDDLPEVVLLVVSVLRPRTMLSVRGQDVVIALAVDIQSAPEVLQGLFDSKGSRCVSGAYQFEELALDQVLAKAKEAGARGIDIYSTPRNVRRIWVHAPGEVSEVC